MTIRSILEQQYNLAKILLNDNRAKVEAMAKMLLDQETIDSKDIDWIMENA